MMLPSCDLFAVGWLLLNVFGQCPRFQNYPLKRFHLWAIRLLQIHEVDQFDGDNGPFEFVAEFVIGRSPFL
jgi:hypothetical protein